MERQQKKINKTRSWFFRKFNKIGQSLASLIKIYFKRQSANIKNERRKITKRVIKIYCFKKIMMIKLTTKMQKTNSLENIAY